jgi:hypothetical protein
MSRKRRNQNQLDKSVVVKTVRIPLSTWEKFERFSKQLGELQGLAFEINLQWKKHLLHLANEYNFHDKDIFGSLEENLRKLPRQIRFISSGYYPPLSMPDEDMQNCNDLELAERCSKKPSNYKKSKNYNIYPQKNGTHKSYHPAKVMHVRIIIEDISDGEL